jgi:hypothetical protein
MRTKTLINGFKNSQKIRVIIDGLGLYMTVGEIAERFATGPHRAAVWLTAEKLAGERQTARAKHGWSGVPSGIAHRINVHSRDFDVQLDVL